MNSQTAIATPDPIALSRPAAGVTAEDAQRVAAATTDLPRFVVLMMQLGLLLGVFALYDLEDPAFGVLSLLVTGGFAIHYWLPFEWKERFYIGWSLAGAFVLLSPVVAALTIVIGLMLFGIVALPVAFRWRLAIVGVVATLLMYGRATLGFGLPVEFWPVFGAIFMFRFAIYLYDAAHAKTAPRLTDFLAYFFVLPNYYFLLFPVVDFQTCRQTYFRRNINDIAQQGVQWIARGTIQLLIYRLIYQWKGPSNAPDQITSFFALASSMVLTFLLYLRVSGQFHIIIGFLHLFGYDLPETHRKYLLSRSLTDLWRRINIYWKDFMVKLVYFPVFFRLRRSGLVRAQLVATMVVIVATWFLHAYQWFWLRGNWQFSWPDTLFWMILGTLLTINIFMEGRRPRGVGATVWQQRLAPLKMVGTFSMIVVLWSLWNSPSLPEWFDLITWWKLG